MSFIENTNKINFSKRENINGHIPISEENGIDILNGAAMYCSGGGGSKSVGMTLLQQTVRHTGPEKICELVQMNMLEPNDNIVPAALFGSPDTTRKEGVMDTFKPIIDVGLRAWKLHHGCPLNYLIAVETGPANNIAPILICAMENDGKPEPTCFVVDGDFQGRSVLSLSMLAPYTVKDISMKRVCYAHIRKDDKVPEGALAHTFIELNGERFCVAGFSIPESISTPDEVEAYLGNEIRNNSHSHSVMSVFWSPIKVSEIMGELPLQSVTPSATLSVSTYTSSKREPNLVKAFPTPLCVPNTLSRSARIGEALRTSNYNAITDLMVDEGAEFICRGQVKRVIFSSDGRSDQGYWVVGTNNGKEIAGIFHNETVFVGELINGEFFPIASTPSTIGVYIYESTGSETNCFLTNDEIAALKKEMEEGAVFNVLVYTLPPAPLLLTQEMLSCVGPSSWNLTVLPGISTPLHNLPLIPSKNQFVAPRYHNKRILLEEISH